MDFFATSLLRRLLCLFFLLTLPAGTVPAFAQSPPPQKIDALIELLNDPTVKAWLAEQKKKSAAAETTQSPTVDVPPLSDLLARIRVHLHEIAAAIPRLPAQFERAWIILLLEFKDEGLIAILALIAGFIAAGLGADRLLRRYTAGYRRWMFAQSHQTPHGRVRALGGRLLYALLTTTAFVIGSAGVFLIFDWPPLLREIVLGYLTVAITIRATMMVTRALLMPPHLHIANRSEFLTLPMSDARAAHWYRWIAINVAWFAFVGTTMMLLGTFGFDLQSKNAIGIPASFVQLLLLLAAVWLRPQRVLVEDEQSGRIGTKAASWLLTALFILLWLLWVSGAYAAFWLILTATALPAAILLAHTAVAYTLRPPPPDVVAKPVPPVLFVVVDRGIRMVLIVVAAFLLTRALHLDVTSMAQGDSLSVRLSRGIFNAAIIFLAADFAWSIAKAIIARKLDTSDAQGGGHDHPLQPKEARLRTLLPIFQNILFAVIVVMTILMVLSAVGIEIGPLIAGAGVVGVAIGFGAQTLVKDVISGMFYLLDDAFRVGEYIESGSYRGTVESFSLRSVKLRHHRGYLFTVPFGELGAVQNMSRDWVIDKFSITVGYDTDVDKVRKIVRKIGQQLAEDPEFKAGVIEPLKMQGVQKFGDFGIELRIKMKTKPGEQFAMKRRAFILIKNAFEEAGITIPFPTVHVKEGESHAGAAARVITAPESQPPAA